MSAVSRQRAVWVCGMILAVGVSAEARAEDWIGERVFPRKEETPLRYEARTVGKFSYDARVTRDLGEWIEVRHAEGTDGHLGCVKKGEVVRASEAVDYFTEVIRQEPNNSWAYVNRGNAWLIRGERSIAVKDLDEAVRLNPLSANYISRGNLRQDLQDYAGAIRDFDEAIRLDPKAFEPYSNRGDAKTKLRDYTGGIRDYDEAIRLNPKEAITYNNRGWTKQMQKDYAGAIRDYRESIRLDEKLPSPWNNYAFLLATAADEKIRDAGKAMTFAEEVLKANPTNYYSKNAKACALALRGDFAEAIRWEREALQDADFAADDSLDGGKRGLERIAAWEQKKLWLQP